jgi:hypothetical protein
MGLDMYLTKNTYVKNWEHTPDNLKHKITIKKGGKVVKDINPNKISHIIEEVAYWRKFNALHNWFVQNCNDGVDDCKLVHIDIEKISLLVDNLKEVKASLDSSPKVIAKVQNGWVNGDDIYADVEVFEKTDVADDLFPTASGFFFGGVEYDNYYYNSLVETLEIFEGILAEKGGDYYYQASW